MKLTRKKFETAVHLGLLVIIFVLIFLNFRSNLVIYRSLNEKRLNSTVRLRASALSISRMVQKQNLDELSQAQIDELVKGHSLSGVWLVSPGASEADIGDVPGEIKRLLAERADKRLVQLDSNEYAYIYPFSTMSGQRRLVVKATVPDLAYLDQSSRTLLVVNLIAVLAIVVFYLMLFRVILAPFKKIKRQALIAGRIVGEDRDDVEAMVEEYQNIINELQEKESELVALNQSIQKRADSLQEFNEYLLTSMSSGLIMIGADGRILSVNEAARRMTGISVDDQARRNYRDIAGFGDEVRSSVEAVLNSRRNQTYQELDILASDGSSISVGINISAIHDHKLSNIGASVLINDLTEIKKLRREMEARNQLAALGEMAGGLAHQLRNSIGAMTGYCHLIRKRLVKNELETDSITALEEETKEAESLVDRFLSFARPFHFSPGPADVAELVDDIIESFKIKVDNRHVDFVVSSDECLQIAADIDSLLVKQALANLIENAVNAYEGLPGRVDIELSHDSETLYIRVIDQGCGIAAGDLEKIFTPFYSSRPSGTGLGLPLTKKIIDLHQGRLTIDSEPGRGTVFTVALPLSQPSPQPV